MDWSPSAQQSQYRAFAPVEQRDIFGQVSAEPNQSPFWYKVPPAPISKAHRLRNPPNPPRLRVSSQEVKENFFNNVTRKSQAPGQSQQNGADLGNNKIRHEVEFAQQKFFPPATSEPGDGLADLLTSFTLGDDPPVQAQPHSTTPHIVQSIILLVGLLWWCQESYYPSAHSKGVQLAIMAVCFSLGIRNVVDNTLSNLTAKKHTLAKTLGCLLGSVACLAASYGGIEVYAERGDYGDRASLGMILLGGMMVQEIWYVSFG